MKESDFQSLKDIDSNKNIIKIIDLNDLTPRTLIYGFTSERDTFHLYLDDQNGSVTFNRVVYDSYNVIKKNISMFEMNEIGTVECLPDKRVYPAASDFEFCKILANKGRNIPFTTFDERPEMLFYGKKSHELIEFENSITPKYRGGDQVIIDFAKSLRLSYSSHILDSIIDPINGQIEGFFRSVLLSGNSISDSKKWLDHIAPSLRFHIKKKIEQNHLSGYYDREPDFNDEELDNAISSLTLAIEKEMIERVENTMDKRAPRKMK